MDAKTLWKEFLQKNKLNEYEYDTWSFGAAPDLLAKLVCEGIKTATSSLLLLYRLEKTPIPQNGTYSVILDSKQQAVCVIKTTNVYIIPFDKVTADHAYKEGEGDQSLKHWKKIHKDYFTNC